MCFFNHGFHAVHNGILRTSSPSTNGYGNGFRRIAQKKTDFAIDFPHSICYTIFNHFETEDFVTMDDGDGADCNRSRAKTTYVACETRTCKAFLRSHIGYRYAFLQFLRLLT